MYYYYYYTHVFYSILNHQARKSISICQVSFFIGKSLKLRTNIKYVANR